MEMQCLGESSWLALRVPANSQPETSPANKINTVLKTCLWLLNYRSRWIPAETGIAFRAALGPHACQSKRLGLLLKPASPGRGRSSFCAASQSPETCLYICSSFRAAWGQKAKFHSQKLALNGEGRNSLAQRDQGSLKPPVSTGEV